MSKEDVYEFIRTRLAFDFSVIKSLRYNRNNWYNEHRRFEMSGYETTPGQCTVYNLNLLNLLSRYI